MTVGNNESCAYVLILFGFCIQKKCIAPAMILKKIRKIKNNNTAHEYDMH